MVARRQYSEHPPRYEYELTEAGQELRGVLTALRAWGDKWMVDTPPSVFDHACGHELDPAVVCRHCGAEVDPGDLTRPGPHSRLDPPGPGDDTGRRASRLVARSRPGGRLLFRTGPRGDLPMLARNPLLVS